MRVLHNNRQKTIQIISEKNVTKRVKKGPKVLEPVFSQKRYSLRKSDESNSSKKLKFEDIQQNSSLDTIDKDSGIHRMDISDKEDTNNSKEEELPEVPKSKRGTKIKRVCDKNLDKMMDELIINEKSSTIYDKHFEPKHRKCLL